MQPLVSIGVPLYNEEKFLRIALDSLLAQTYNNIEIIICDNASTDKTKSITIDYVEKNKNIQLYQETENQGALNNFIKVLTLSKGKYFMWASGHDTWSPTLVANSVHQLEQHNNAAIAFGTTTWINENNVASARESGWTDTRGMHKIERFLTTIIGNIHPILGVMRRDYLIKAPFIYTAGTDLIILAYLSLKGDFIHTTESICYRRELDIRKKESQKDRMNRYKNNEFKLSLGFFNKIFPLFRLPIELFSIILKSNLSIFEKFYTLFACLPVFLIKYFVSRKK